MFTMFVMFVHVVVCVALILIILLQSGKGADIGAVFGGGSSQTVFGSGGATTFLSKVTVGAAVTFMVTSIILTYFSGRMLSPVESSVMQTGSAPISVPQQAAPLPEGAPADVKTDAPAAAPTTPAAPVEKAPESSGTPSGGDGDKSSGGGQEPR
jgi:preprotein translocase subunit SecG